MIDAFSPEFLTSPFAKLPAGVPAVIGIKDALNEPGQRRVRDMLIASIGAGREEGTIGVDATGKVPVALFIDRMSASADETGKNTMADRIARAMGLENYSMLASRNAQHESKPVLDELERARAGADILNRPSMLFDRAAQMLHVLSEAYANAPQSLMGRVLERAGSTQPNDDPKSAIKRGVVLVVALDAVISEDAMSRVPTAWQEIGRNDSTPLQMNLHRIRTGLQQLFEQSKPVSGSSMPCDLTFGWSRFSGLTQRANNNHFLGN